MPQDVCPKNSSDSIAQSMKEGNGQKAQALYDLCNNQLLNDAYKDVDSMLLRVNKAKAAGEQLPSVSEMVQTINKAAAASDTAMNNLYDEVDSKHIKDSKCKITKVALGQGVYEPKVVCD